MASERTSLFLKSDKLVVRANWCMGFSVSYICTALNGHALRNSWFFLYSLPTHTFQSTPQ